MKERIFMSIDREGINTPAYYETDGKNNNMLIRSLSDAHMCGVFINGISSYVNQTQQMTGLTLIDIKQTGSRTFETLRIHQSQISNNSEASAAINWINTNSGGDVIVFCMNTDINRNDMFVQFMTQRGAGIFENFSNSNESFRFVGVMNSKNKKFVASQAKTSSMGETQLDLMFNTLDDIGQSGYGQTVVEQTKEFSSETNPVIVFPHKTLASLNLYSGETLLLQTEFQRDVIAQTNDVTCELYVMFHAADLNIISSQFITPSNGNDWKTNEWVTVTKNIVIPSNAVGLSVRLIRKAPNTNKNGIAVIRNTVIGTIIDINENANSIQGTVIPYGLSSRSLSESKLENDISVILATDKITTKRLSILGQFSAMLLQQTEAVMPKFSATDYYSVVDIKWNYRDGNTFGTEQLGIKIVNHSYVLMYSDQQYTTNKKVKYGIVSRHQIRVVGNNLKFVVDGEELVNVTISNKVTDFVNYSVGGTNCDCVLYLMAFYDLINLENNITYDVTNQYSAKLKNQFRVMGFTLGSGIREEVDTKLTNGRLIVKDATFGDEVMMNILSVGAGSIASGFSLNTRYKATINSAGAAIVNGTTTFATGNTTDSLVRLELVNNPDIHLNYPDDLWTDLNQESFILNGAYFKFDRVLTNNTVVTFSFIVPSEHFNKNQTLIDLRTSTSQSNNRLIIENGVLKSNGFKLNYVNKPLNNVNDIQIYPDVPYYIAVTLTDTLFLDKIGCNFNATTPFFGKIWNIGVTSNDGKSLYYSNELKNFKNISANTIDNINTKKSWVNHDSLTNYTISGATRLNDQTIRLTSSKAIIKKQMFESNAKIISLDYGLVSNHANVTYIVRHSRGVISTGTQKHYGKFSFEHVSNTSREIEIEINGVVGQEVTIEYFKTMDDSDGCMINGNFALTDFVYATSHISSQSKHMVLQNKIIDKFTIVYNHAESFNCNMKVLKFKNTNKHELIALKNASFEMYVQNNNLTVKKGTSTLSVPIINTERLELNSFRVELIYDELTKLTTIRCGNQTKTGNVLTRTDYFEEYGPHVMEVITFQQRNGSILTGHHYNFVRSFYGDISKESRDVLIKNELRISRKLKSGNIGTEYGFELSKFGTLYDTPELGNSNIFWFKTISQSGYTASIKMNQQYPKNFTIEIYDTDKQMFIPFDCVQLTFHEFGIQTDEYVRNWFTKMDAVKSFNIIERYDFNIRSIDWTVIDE